MRLTLAGFVLLDDKVGKAGRQLVHDVLLRDGRQTSLDAELRAVRSLAGLLDAGGDLRRSARRFGRDREDHGLDEVGALGCLRVCGHGRR